MSDPEAVAKAVAITQATWDTRLDESPQDAARRAVSWMVPALAQRTREARTAGGGAWWSRLAATKGWTTATATEWAPISSKKAQRQVTLLVSISAHDAALNDQHELLIVTLDGGTAAQSGTTPNPVPQPHASAPSSSSTTPTRWLVSQITYLPAT